MKTIVSIGLLALSTAASAPEASAQSRGPATDQPATLTVAPPLEINAIWHFPTPVAPRPRQCQAFWHPTQYWHTDASGNTYTWVTYAQYFYCR